MSNQDYYVPHGTYWPILGSLGIATLFVGFANSLHGSEWGGFTMVVGSAIIIFMMFGWLGQVVSESVGGLYSAQVDRSFRWGMGWFIFSEVMFFAAFFGALFYARQFAIPWLSGEGNNFYTPELWNGFKATWDSIAFSTPGTTLQSGVEISTPDKLVHWSGLPLVNTILLVLSGVTITFAHHALRKAHRNALMFWMVATIALGVAFLGFQALEYGHAYHDGLKLTSGIYGSTFYMLTGFHGLHVTIGVIMLTVMLFRIQRGHFDANNHFAFEATAWYWHFVDVVWFGLFIFVYII